MARRTRIKICGITRAEDARVAVSCGVDAIGLNFVAGAKREISLETAAAIVGELPPGVEPVGVFRDADVQDICEIFADIGVGVAQLHGDEPPQLVQEIAPNRAIKSCRWSDDVVAQARTFAVWVRSLGGSLVGFLIDAPTGPGGAGVAWDYSKLNSSELGLPVFLAGGLTPENVGAAIRAVRPYGVDVASGVESSPGIKDERKIAAFVEAVRAADLE